MTQSRTHTCNELRMEHVGRKVRIVGWMENVRVVGANFAFVVLRDFYGTTQVVIETEDMMNVVKPLNKETTVAVEGVVRERDVQDVAGVDPMGIFDLRVGGDDLVQPYAVADGGLPHRVSRYDDVIQRRGGGGESQQQSEKQSEDGETDRFSVHNTVSSFRCVLPIVCPGFCRRKTGERRGKNQELPSNDTLPSARPESFP